MNGRACLAVLAGFGVAGTAACDAGTKIRSPDGAMTAVVRHHGSTAFTYVWIERDGRRTDVGSIGFANPTARWMAPRELEVCARGQRVEGTLRRDVAVGSEHVTVRTCEGMPDLPEPGAGPD